MNKANRPRDLRNRVLPDYDVLGRTSVAGVGSTGAADAQVPQMQDKVRPKVKRVAWAMHKSGERK